MLAAESGRPVRAEGVSSRCLRQRATWGRRARSGWVRYSGSAPAGGRRGPPGGTARAAGRAAGRSLDHSFVVSLTDERTTVGGSPWPSPAGVRSRLRAAGDSSAGGRRALLLLPPARAQPEQ